MTLVFRKSHYRDREPAWNSLHNLRLVAPPPPSSADKPSQPVATDSPVIVDRLKPGPLSNLSENLGTFKEQLRGATVFRPLSSDPDTLADALRFKVLREGGYYIAATWKSKADSAKAVTREQLVEQGWEDLGPSPWEQDLYPPATPACKAGESFQIQTSKYYPPSLIVPEPLWKKAPPPSTR